MFSLISLENPPGKKARNSSLECSTIISTSVQYTLRRTERLFKFPRKSEANPGWPWNVDGEARYGDDATMRRCGDHFLVNTVHQAHCADYNQNELCSRAESIDWTQFLETAQNEWETPFGVSGLGCAAQKASWEELEALKAPFCLLPSRVPHHAHRRTRRHLPQCASTRF